MMNSIILFLFTLTCCLVMKKQQVSASTLPNPTIKLVTNDPQNIIIKKDTITLKCIKGSAEGNKFEFVHQNTDGKSETQKRNTEEFVLENVQIEHEGNYSCRYCSDRDCSALSSPLNIYVHDTFPRPLINVSPRRVVQPGATVTITCSTRYPNVEFSLLKNNMIVNIGSSSGNQFSYVISNAVKDNVGYYSCIYRSISTGMPSDKSNSMKISVLALPAPDITLEEDPTDSTILGISCVAPDNLNYNKFFFTLLDHSNVVDEITANKSAVKFSITKPKFTVKRYLCMYKVKHDYDYADSLYSMVQIDSKGFYILMFIRHILSAFILILLGAFLLKHFKNYGNTHEKPPNLPPIRVKYAKGTDVIWTSDDE